ncbi:MAG: hypothetical protein L0154_17220 [Chloroflexi bacterium]|nr:hypothetical protein [Chloroflexota bacterium]
MRKLVVLLMALVILAALLLMSLVAVTAQEGGGDEDEEAALLERGEYLVHIAACWECHTPHLEEYNKPDLTDLSLEQIQTFALSTLDTLDFEEHFMAGGRPFPSPMGVVFSANLTADEATGVGSWTDEQLEIAIRQGVNPTGRRLFPVMPYLNFYNLAERDVDAIIAYLRTIEPVENEVDRSGPSGEGIAPVLEPRDDLPELPPDGSDPVELGEYLVRNVMSCNDCHTPLDSETGAPIPELALSGGFPFEGPWGIVYAGNITPDEETGLGSWTEEDYVRVFREGVNREGRRLIFMPWEAYGSITDDDLAALIAYLQSIEPIENEIPAPAIEDDFLQFVEE